jgi:hypothetical protein
MLPFLSAIVAMTMLTMLSANFAAASDWLNTTRSQGPRP